MYSTLAVETQQLVTPFGVAPVSLQVLISQQPPLSMLRDASFLYEPRQPPLQHIPHQKQNYCKPHWRRYNPEIALLVMNAGEIRNIHPEISSHER